MKRKNVSLIAGAAVCTLTVLLTVMYAVVSGMFVHAEYIPPCDTDSIAAEAIQTVTKSGLISTEQHAGAVYFYPDRSVTRGELAKTLCVLLSLPVRQYEKAPLGFADEASIPEADLPYIRAVLVGGYIRLFGDYTFRADDVLSREETADIFGSLLSGAVSTGKSEALTDFETVSDHFKTNAKKAVEYGIMIGYPDETFRPKETLTRKELAMLLHRLLQNEHFIKRNS
jgi:hypothetical protein